MHLGPSVVLLSALVLSSCTHSQTVFKCDTNGQCDSATGIGLCVSAVDGNSKVCAFGDTQCPSGFRYDVSSGTTACYQAPPRTVRLTGGLSPLVLDSPVAGHYRLRSAGIGGDAICSGTLCVHGGLSQ